MLDKLSIILPTFNEVKSLEYVVKTWSEYLNAQGIEHEFIICEDGSIDGTKNLVQKLLLSYPIVNESTETRRGYGGGVLAGIVAAKNNFILCIDSDGQCMPDSFLDLWNLRNNYEIIIGRRNPRRDPYLRIVYSKIFYLLHKILFLTKIHDPSCPYILAKNTTYKNLMPYLVFMKEGFWWGFIGASIKKNMTVKEVNIIHYERYDGDSNVYKVSKMPGIILRNIVGLVKLKFHK